MKTGNEEEEKSMEDGHSSSADTVTVIFDDQPEGILTKGVQGLSLEFPVKFCFVL